MYNFSIWLIDTEKRVILYVVNEYTYNIFFVGP